MPALLDTLKDASVRALFFVMGRNIEEPAWDNGVERSHARAMILRAIADGHEIGNHSYSHARDRSAESVMSEVPWMDKLIRELREEAGAPRDERILVRLPYGVQPSGDPRADALRAVGREPIQWTLMLEDWMPRNPIELCNEMLRHVRLAEQLNVTAVLAMHVSGESAQAGYERPWTVEAVRLFLQEAKRHGWASVVCPT